MKRSATGIHLEMTSKTIQRSSRVGEACDTFVKELKTWVYSCMHKYSDAHPTDGHDQLTYTTGWEPYIRAARDETVIRFLKSSRDAVAAHFVENNMWYHGYWRIQEAHHGTEHFELFLGFMSRVDPEDAETKKQILDAAEHIGNWNPDVPDWFDDRSGLFFSLFFGTDGVRSDSGMELNMPDHLRCVNILLISYKITQESKYLELAERYAAHWVDALLSGDQIPIGITKHGGIYEFDDESEKMYRSFAGMAGRLDDDTDRTENILASGGINALVSLWDLSGEAEYLEAAERLLDILVPELTDPDAGPAADALRYYRRVTGRNKYDTFVREAVAGLSPFDIKEIAIGPKAKRASRPAGIGKRKDMPVWFEDGRPRRHNPVLLSLAAEITSDTDLAKCSVDLARTYFQAAKEVLTDGRDHGCAAGTISAIARGHGRNNHAGMATAVLAPIMDAFT